MCGPSGTQIQLEQQEQQFSQVLQQNFTKNEALQGEILQNLNATLAPIVSAGPGQTGYSPEELAALNTQALDTTGANYANAARATNSQLAGRGDSSNPESGVDQQIKASLASASAGQLSNEELGITKSNYDTGRANWQTALAGESSVAGQENPLGYAGATTSANEGAFGEANTIQQESNQEEADIFGGITSLAGVAAKAAFPGASALSGGPMSGVDPATLTYGSEEANLPGANGYYQ